MLTDVFSFRYANNEIWKSITPSEKKLILQIFSIIGESLAPYYDYKGAVIEQNKAFWSELHKRVAVELGLKQLSPIAYYYPPLSPGQFPVSDTFTYNIVCENWMLETPKPNESADSFIKDRLSLVEVAFRMREQIVIKLNDELSVRLEKLEAQRSQGIKNISGIIRTEISTNNSINEKYYTAVEELNHRFRQSGCNLHYHNGFIQISKDNLILSQVEEPFWLLLRDPIWRNVDIDMKEAIDVRDSGGRDPAFFAARALESSIKIISDQKGFTSGNEKGAHNYIDNISSNSRKYIQNWERDILKKFFTEVRNPFGHGAGSGDMPSLSAVETDVAIEFCMVWIKSLVRRI